MIKKLYLYFCCCFFEKVQKGTLRSISSEDTIDTNVYPKIEKGSHNIPCVQFSN